MSQVFKCANCKKYKPIDVKVEATFRRPKKWVKERNYCDKCLEKMMGEKNE